MSRARRHSPSITARAARVATIAAGAVAIAACTSAGGTAEQTPQPSATSSSPGAAPRCRQEGPRYLAFLASGTCRDVQGSEGTWVARPLFPEAPAAIRDTACAYQWTGSAAATAPDLAILTTIGAEHLTRDVEVTMSCAARVLPPGSAAVVPSIAGDGGESSPTGVSGCDVCARLSGKTLFAILPPDRLDLHTAVVLTPSGRYITFGMSVPEGTQAFAVDLPADALESYKEGRVPLFRAPQ